MNGRFEAYVPLHRLWLGYISELLGLGPQPAGAVTEENAARPSAATMHAKLVKADFHGSIMTGERCFILCFAGLISDGQCGRAGIRASSGSRAWSCTSLRTDLG
jgi:hypothetical protein